METTRDISNPSKSRSWLISTTVANPGVDTKIPTELAIRTALKAAVGNLFDAGSSGAAKTLNWNDGQRQLVTLTGNVTFTLTNPVDGVEYTIIIATGAGAFTATWPASVLWPGGTAPTITVAAAKVDIIRLLFRNGTTQYYGSFLQNY